MNQAGSKFKCKGIIFEGIPIDSIASASNASPATSVSSPKGRQSPKAATLPYHAPLSVVKGNSPGTLVETMLRKVSSSPEPGLKHC